VLRETFNWEKLSVIAGLTLRRFYFRIYEGSINGERAAEFLRALRRHLRGRLLVIWDGAAIHRSQPVKAVLAESRGRLWLERLPAYAPELNPVEYLWAHLKEHEIANLLVAHGWELGLHATRALRRMRRRPRIIRACWVQSELCL
jgi:transposase